MFIVKRAVRAARSLGRGVAPDPGAAADLAQRLDRIERKLDAIEHHSHGARAVYMGGGRVLAKVVVRDANLAYLVEADDRLISPWLLITGTYETELTDFLVSHLQPDSRCIDAGANFGFFTCLMARFAPNGRVVGVEADPKVWALARDNVMINGFGHARAMNAAVSDGAAPVTLHRRSTRSGNTSIIKVGVDLTEHHGEPPAEPFEVRGVTIDEIADTMDGRVDFLKIDIEGAEPLAFRGMSRTLDRNPDLTILMEWSPGQIAAAGFDVPAFLDEAQALGLRFFDIREGEPTPLSAAQLLELPYLFAIAMKRDGAR